MHLLGTIFTCVLINTFDSDLQQHPFTPIKPVQCELHCRVFSQLMSLIHLNCIAFPSSFQSSSRGGLHVVVCYSPLVIFSLSLSTELLFLYV